MLFDSDDLMSLLDAGIHSDHQSVIIDSEAMFNENMFGYSALRGRTSQRARTGIISTLLEVLRGHTSQRGHTGIDNPCPSTIDPTPWTYCGT